MVNQTELSVILPAYLEAENLQLLLPRLNDVLTTSNIFYEILVIDTQTALDTTRDVCLKYGAAYINREKSNSFGSAVRTGISQAQGKYILFMDADGSHPPEFIPRLLPFRAEYDVVVASRYVAGGETENSWPLILMSKIVNLVYSFVLQIKCQDVSNSFKLYRAELLKELKLSCNNFDVVEEILYKVFKNNKNLRLKEIPFTFKQRLFGKTKRNLWQFMITYIFTLLRLKFVK